LVPALAKVAPGIMHFYCFWHWCKISIKN
jgi:hypothetical protein